MVKPTQAELVRFQTLIQQHQRAMAVIKELQEVLDVKQIDRKTRTDVPAARIRLVTQRCACGFQVSGTSVAAVRAALRDHMTWERENCAGVE